MLRKQGRKILISSDILLPHGAHILTKSQCWEKLVFEKGTSMFLCLRSLRQSLLPWCRPCLIPQQPSEGRRCYPHPIKEPKPYGC